MNTKTLLKATPLLAIFALSFAGNSRALDQAPPAPESDAKKIAKGAVIQAGRIAVGDAVGGAVGAVIKGNPVTAAVGVFLTPSEIGCGEGEQCARR